MSRVALKTDVIAGAAKIGMMNCAKAIREKILPISALSTSLEAMDLRINAGTKSAKLMCLVIVVH